MAIRIPQPQSLEIAIKLYYEKNEIKNEDIKMLFGSLGSARIANLKRLAREEMQRNEIMSWDATAVNTECAYHVWGINIESCERKYNKLKKLFGGS